MTATAIEKSTKDARLPLTVVPQHYDLSYHRLDFVAFTFEGTVAIECILPVGSTSKTSNSIILHATELQLTKATLTEKSSSASSASPSWQAEEFRYHLKDQTCEIVFGDKTVEWKDGVTYVLQVDFAGILNDQMHGLYRSVYTTTSGESRIMASTQFESTDARRAFPCFDEPALKATFCLSVTVAADYQCVSNTPTASVHTARHAPQQQQQQNQAFKTVTFQMTPKMSTYLLALVVGHLDSISQTSNHIVTTVYTTEGKAHQGQFCLDTAVRCLDLYQTLFAIPYPLTKSDLLAIPDFSAGAMENWGCVTYREAKVLVKPGETSETTKRGIARTVCHELAHQWFGNLVTMEFWTQLWLNEGSARFMEFVAVNALFPDWNIWNEFVQSVYNLALSLDAMKTSHPVEVVVNRPEEITEIFDTISYAKGASIIRMISTHIGLDVYLTGMQLYLTRHAYANAVTNDLWKALEEVSGAPVVDLMNPWTLQTGYPILILNNNGAFEAKRFLASGPDDSDTTKWPMPVTAQVQDNDAVQGPWVIYPDGSSSKDESATIRSKIAEWTAAGKWFKLNVNQTAFFRVSYTPEQWKLLSTAMSLAGPLSVMDRLGLISDSFAAGKAGYASIVESLRLVEGFGQHDVADYVVWQELAENLAGLASLLRSEPFYPQYQSFLSKIFSKQMKRLGWQDSSDGVEDSRTGTLRATVISMMRIAGDTETLKEAFDRFMAFRQNPDQSAIAGDLRESIYMCALRYDEATVYKELKMIFEDPHQSPEEQRNSLGVMGCVKDPQRHAEMLDYVFHSGKVRKMDIAVPLSSLATSSDEGGLATWRFFQTHYRQLQSIIGGSGMVWASVAALACRGLNAWEHIDDVEHFFADPAHAPGSAKRRISQAMEVVRTKIERRNRDRDALASYLNE